MAATALDANLFPHIWELVQSHAPHALLLRLRLVSRAASGTATRALFAHVEVRQVHVPSQVAGEPVPVTAAVAFAHGGGRLPLPPARASAADVEGVDLPPHPGWIHTRVLDAHTSLRDVQPYVVDLTVVRRFPGVVSAPPTFTYVDVLHAPPRGRAGGRACVRVRPTGALTERHVFVVLYDAGVPMLPAEGLGMRFPQAPAGEDAVFVFRRDPRSEESAPAPRIPGEDSGPCGTLLRPFLDLAAEGTHASYTFVGLEGVPTHVLALELGLDVHDVAEVANVTGGGAVGRAEWTAFVADNVLHCIYGLGGLRDGAVEHTRVLTMGAFRAEVGEEDWVLETMADVGGNDFGA